MEECGRLMAGMLGCAPGEPTGSTVAADCSRTTNRPQTPAQLLGGPIVRGSTPDIKGSAAQEERVRPRGTGGDLPQHCFAPTMGFTPHIVPADGVVMAQSSKLRTHRMTTHPNGRSDLRPLVITLAARSLRSDLEICGAKIT